MSEITNCPQCGGILPAGANLCPQCAREALVNEPTILSPASGSDDSRIPSELIRAAEMPAEIGPYQILGKLGEGGMGAVYEARQPALDRKVALKVMSRKLDQDSTFRQRFEREAKAAAAITHPNLVHVYDYGEADGCRFIAMEMIEGGSVGKRLKQTGKFPPAEAIEVVYSAASALQAAAEIGVIHRDIKPDNLLIDKKNRVRVADLGLAKQVDVESNVTLVGAVLGSPYYMAPEQAEDVVNADHRADIYSLGITFYHLLTGKRPFTGKSVLKIIQAHSSVAMPTLAASSVILPPVVEETIQRMTAKNPADRFPDYHSLLQALAACRESLQSSSSPTFDTTTGFTTAEDKQQRDLLFTALACVALLLVALAVRTYVKRSRQAALPPPAPVSTFTPPATRAPEPAETNAVDQLPRDHQSVFELYQSINFQWSWLPFRVGRPPRPPNMNGAFAENLKQADDYARDNPDDLAGIVMHYRVALQTEFASTNRAIIQKKLDHWLNQETEKFSALFRDYDARMKKLAAQKRYREAYEVWSDFPPDYPFPRFTALIWGAITANIPEAELRAILEERP